MPCDAEPEWQMPVDTDVALREIGSAYQLAITGRERFAVLTLAALYARGILTIVSDWLSHVSPISYATDLVRFAAEGGAASTPRLGGKMIRGNDFWNTTLPPSATSYTVIASRVLP